MQSDSDEQAAKAEAEAKGRPAGKRAEVARARFQVAAQKDAALAAGGKPTDAEALRMLSEFHARGGRVTVCAPADETPPGTEGGRGETR